MLFLFPDLFIIKSFCHDHKYANFDAFEKKKVLMREIKGTENIVR